MITGTNNPRWAEIKQQHMPRYNPSDHATKWRVSRGDIVALALGANRRGSFGTPVETLRAAIGSLTSSFAGRAHASALFATMPEGGGRQPRYVNAVMIARCTLGPARLLRQLKQRERDAGRRPGRTWGPRPLDIDIVACGTTRIRWPLARGPRPGLIVPHPFAHRRAFVLLPLLSVAPTWRHPALHRSARDLALRLPPAASRGVREIADSPTPH
jgi:2-amino-4-hydroxy-6-hydroxymethyldihydropteridine diphosphokinase